MAWTREQPKGGRGREIEPFGRVLIALFLIAGAPTAASCALAYGFTPDDGLDDRPALQREIDRIAAAGGGTLQLEQGVYDIATPLYLRSGVHIAGRGRDTVISSKRLNKRSRWLGTTIFAGNLTPGSFSDDMDEGYPGRPARRTGDRTLTLQDCGSDNLPAPGEILWLSSHEEMRGRAERRKPAYGEMTVAVAVDGCRVEVADPIRVPSPDILIHWSDGSRAIPRGAPNAPIKDAGIRDLTLEAGEGTALIPSGCYRCDFTNLHIVHTLRLIGAQGQRHTRFKGITGNFRWRGIEVVMYASDVVIEDVDAELRDPVREGVRPAIRFGEYARDNIVRNVRLRLGEGYVGRDKLRFDESAGNRLENIELIVPRADRRPNYLHRPAGASRDVPNMLPEDTVLDNVRLCVGGGSGGCESID